MKLLWISLALLAVSCTSKKQAKLFTEGTIEYRITYEKGIEEDTRSLMAGGLTVKVKGDRLYLKMKGGIADLKPPVVIDMGTQEMLYFNYLDSTVLPKSVSSLDFGRTFKEAGRGETISGYITTRYKAVSGGNEYTIDAADAVPLNISNTVIFEGFYLSSFNKLPLRIQVKEPGLSFSVEAESVKEETVPDTIFTIPKGFRIRRP